MRPNGGDFQFIAVQSPGGVKDRTTKRLARSHAVRVALQNKRKLQQEAGRNFRITTLQKNASQTASNEHIPKDLISLASPLPKISLHPFQMLAANSSRLQQWFIHHKADQSREPVFSISDELVLQNFRSVFRTGLDDFALLNAAMLTLAFAVAGSIDQECLSYHSEALNRIREKMSSPERAASEATLGAILLLAGIETRLNMPFQVQLHLNAIQHLLSVCQTRGVYLTDGIKRAIFWQDLNSSVMTGSTRIVDHTTFTELHWRRDPFAQNDFTLPPGFQRRTHLLTEEFVAVLKDIHAFQCIREASRFNSDDTMAMMQIDNHQAFIQSTLAVTPNVPPFMDCCHLAAYLCAATLRCKIWRDSAIPSQLASKLLCRIQQESQNPVWDDHPEVLVWLLHIGGAFAPTDEIRSQYVSLVHLNRQSRFRSLYESWGGLHGILKEFIWSEKAFVLKVKQFWKAAS